MTKSNPQAPSTLVEVIATTPEQEPILANLLELYIHDFSQFHSMEVGPNGRFGYPDLQRYWSEPGRYPFLVRVDGKLAGLMLVKTQPDAPSEACWNMAEFFIVRGHRRRGIGMRAAHAMWRRFPGQWQVRVMESNYAALLFWQRAIDEFTGVAIHSTRMEKAGEPWQVFSFQSK
jgi:predicted acetyltransferase